VCSVEKGNREKPGYPKLLETGGWELHLGSAQSARNASLANAETATVANEGAAAAGDAGQFATSANSGQS
jgi:hypothetical protein